MNNLSNGLASGDMVLSKAGFAAGTTTTITRAAAVNFVIDGRWYTLAAATNEATPTTDANTGAVFTGIVAGQETCYWMVVNAAGTKGAVEGEILSTSDVSGDTEAHTIPKIPAGYVPYAYLYVKGGSTLSGTWKLGASNTASVTGMTYSFRDIALPPARPITA